jgi:hypothetical protein
MIGVLHFSASLTIANPSSEPSFFVKNVLAHPLHYCAIPRVKSVSRVYVGHWRMTPANKPKQTTPIYYAKPYTNTSRFIPSQR